MEIKITRHLKDRKTNYRLDDIDILSFVKKVIKDFTIEEKKNGFYKFIYDDIILIMLKENTEINLITMYPKKSNKVIYLNVNFYFKQCIYQGEDQEDRDNEVVFLSKTKEKKRKFHINQNKRVKPIRNKSKKSSKEIKKTMDKDIKNMLKNKTATIHKFRDKYNKIEFAGIILKNVEFLIIPKIENGYYYFLNGKQKVLRTLHELDYKKLKEV